MSDQYLVTGNEFVSLPAIRQNDASIDSFTVLHMGFKGMLAFHGGADIPLIKPHVKNSEAVDRRDILPYCR